MSNSGGKMMTRAYHVGVSSVPDLLASVTSVSTCHWLVNQRDGKLNITGMTAGSSLMKNETGEFRNLVSMETAYAFDWMMYSPRQVATDGYRYMTLLGFNVNSGSLIGLLDRGGYDHLERQTDLMDEVSVEVAPRNWTILS